MKKRPWRFLYAYETTLFIVVSVIDFLMTRRLLRTGHFQESNRVARWFSDHWGIDGLFYFKIGMVAFVTLLTQIIAQRRPKTAQWLLHLATAVAAVVVIYSFLLLMRSRGYL